MTATNMCSNYVVSGVVPPLKKTKTCTTVKIIEDQFHVFLGGGGGGGQLVHYTS